ncbi:uncharacterized protein ARMOST_14476 [Armillaria ostoyae]|uniref:Uncharacterized protein n=1 Tax=Armillaria ostoyae TaxID=47428 RepID=A0A284RQW0_ARMOS|nr:uncharacterized protein ARMOST_14476 [Armillaria ostoyae]
MSTSRLRGPILKSRRRRVVLAALHGDGKHNKRELEKILKTAPMMNATTRPETSISWRADTGNHFCRARTMIFTKLSSCGKGRTLAFKR